MLCTFFGPTKSYKHVVATVNFICDQLNMILTGILYLTYTAWGLFFLYLIYYYVRIVSKVALVYHATEINKQIIKGCSLLRGKYWPSIFVFNSHLQVGNTTNSNYENKLNFIKQTPGSHFNEIEEKAGSKVQKVNLDANNPQKKKIKEKKKREIIIAEDGATLELDWGESEGKELKDESPILCLLSGVTGNSSSSYIVYLMTAARQNGWRPVMMNYPNATGSPMTVLIFYIIFFNFAIYFFWENRVLVSFA